MLKLKITFLTKVYYLEYLSFEIIIDWFDSLLSEIYSILKNNYDTDAEETQKHYRFSALLRQKWGRVHIFITGWGGVGGMPI